MTDPIKIKVRRGGWVIDVEGDNPVVADGAWTKAQAITQAKIYAKAAGGSIIEIETVRGGFIETITLEPVVDNGPELPFVEDGRGALETEPATEPEEKPQSARERFGFGGRS